jgi:hypothetical protein
MRAPLYLPARRSKRLARRFSAMQTAAYCRRKVEEMEALAAKSPVTREQYLEMAAKWSRLELESARVERLRRGQESS